MIDISGSEDREIWSKAYCAALNNPTVSDAKYAADKALIDYREKFPYERSDDSMTTIIDITGVRRNPLLDM
jgi:hypothetical protein